MRKQKIVTIIIILVVLLIAILILTLNKGDASEELTKCIGEKATLYIREGCVHCKTQEDMFGENLKYLTIINCNEDWSKCSGLLGAPSWKIEEQLILGVQSLDSLKQITGC